jgi:glycosyltransferase involved in cell wall biosynthesis
MMDKSYHLKPQNDKLCIIETMNHSTSKPLVSVIVLTYNREKFIGEAIKSVLAQSYQNFELIIIDDGSTDNTPVVVNGFLDQRLRYIRHEANAGLLKRRQESLTYVKGKYIAILDSDDVWLNTSKLDKQVEYLEDHPEYSLLGTFVRLIDDTGQSLGEVLNATEDKTLRRRSLHNNQFAHSSVLIRTSAVEKTAGYRFKLAEDFDLFLQLGQVGLMAILPEVMTSYRVHGKSASHHRLAMIECALEILKTHRNHYPHFYYGYIKYYLYALLLKIRGISARLAN